MNATMLSGGLRAGPILPRHRVHAEPAAAEVAPAPALSVAERGGVWCVVGQDGATLAPCSDESTARAHAVALSRLSSFFRQ